MKKWFLFIVLPVLSFLLFSVSAFATTATYNIRRNLSVIYPASSYIDTNFLGNKAFSDKFWELYKIRFQTVSYFHVTAYYEPSGVLRYVIVAIFDKEPPFSGITAVTDDGGKDGRRFVNVDSATTTAFQKACLILYRDDDGSFSSNFIPNTMITKFHGDQTFVVPHSSGSSYKYLTNYDLTVIADPSSTPSERFVTIKQIANLALPQSSGGGSGGTGGGDIGGGSEPMDGDFQAKVLLPRDGFKQSKLNAIKLKLYYKIPYDGDMNKVKLDVNGYVGNNKNVEFHDINISSDGKVLEGFLDVVGAVSWNKDTTLTFTVTDYKGATYSDSIAVTCYDDFVDEDGDGLDDRTGQDNWTGNPDYNKPPPGSVGNLGSINNIFDSVSGFSSNFVGFLGSFFTFLPPEITAILTLGFAAIVALRIFGR